MEHKHRGDLLNLDPVEEIVKNSYKNFHTKGLDYVCLLRSEEYTLKAYFLDGDCRKVPEVVNPHDHRYRFKTHVLVGTLLDHKFGQTDKGGDVYDAFDYRTPLNGGNGFTWRGEERLKKVKTRVMYKGENLETPINGIHTIQMASDHTVLLLEQFKDEVPIDEPTSTWAKGLQKGDWLKTDPGTYEEFTEDEVRSLVSVVRSLGVRLSPFHF